MMGSEAIAAGPALKKLVEQPQAARMDDVEVATLIKLESDLRRIDPRARPAIAFLTDALSHRYWGVRDKAAQALGELVQEANRAVGALTKALRDTDPDSGLGYMEVRISAAEALWKINHRTDRVLQVLIDTLQDNKGWYYQRAAAALGRMGPAARPAVPALAGSLRCEEVHDYLDFEAYMQSRRAPFEALVQIGPAAKSARSSLQQALNDPEVLIRVLAAETLGKLDSEDPGVLPVLTAALRERSGQVRSSAADALGRLGPPAKGAVPVLVETLSDKYPEVAIRAAAALGQLGPLAQAAVPRLREMRSAKDEDCRNAALQALKKIELESGKSGDK